MRFDYLIKYDRDGNVLWYKIITGGLGNNSIATDTKGNVYLTIDYSNLNIDSVSLTGGGVAIIKFDSIGNITWMEHSIKRSSTGGPYPGAIHVNSHNEVFISGAIRGTHSFGPFTLTQGGSYTDLLIAKIGQDVALNINSPTLINTKEFDVFPNPGKGTFQIKYKTSETEQILLNVFNAAGVKVYSAILKDVSGSYTKQIDLSHLSKGTYFIELQSMSDNENQHNSIERKKIVLQ